MNATILVAPGVSAFKRSGTFRTLFGNIAFCTANLSVLKECYRMFAVGNSRQYSEDCEILPLMH